MSDLYVEGILNDIRALSNEDAFTDTCEIYSFTGNISATNSEGGTPNTYATAPIVVPCRVDPLINRLIPQRVKGNIDVQKVELNIYIPIGTPVNMQDKLVYLPSDPLLPSGVEYRVLEIGLGTDEADLQVLVELLT